MDIIRKEAERAQYLQHNLDDLQKKYNSEIDKLKCERHKVSSKHEQEILCLMRERNFVWDQLKRMEDHYMKSLRSKGVQLEASEKENAKLKLLLEEMQKGQDNKAVNLALLNGNDQESKEGVYQLEEKSLEMNETGSYPAINSLQVAIAPPSALANKPIVAVECEGALQQNNAIRSDIPASKCHQMETFENGNKVEVSFSQLDATMSLASNVKEDLKKATKAIDDLRLENQNLRILYADLEKQLKDTQQMPGGRMTAKGTATRNLNAELDAVAEQNILDAEFDRGSQLWPRRSKSVDDSASLWKAISKWKFENNSLSQKDSERTELAALSPSPRLRSVRKGSLRTHAGPPVLGLRENGTIKKEGWKNCSEDDCTLEVNMRQQLDLLQESQTLENSQRILLAKNTCDETQKAKPRQLSQEKCSKGLKVLKIDNAVLPAGSTLQQRRHQFFSSYFSIPKIQSMVSSNHTR
eukprot:c27967_g1_i1 orf=539-1942(+)